MLHHYFRLHKYWKHRKAIDESFKAWPFCFFVQAEVGILYQAGYRLKCYLHWIQFYETCDWLTKLRGSSNQYQNKQWAWCLSIVVWHVKHRSNVLHIFISSLKFVSTLMEIVCNAKDLDLTIPSYLHCLLSCVLFRLNLMEAKCEWEYRKRSWASNYFIFFREVLKQLQYWWNSTKNLLLLLRTYKVGTNFKIFLGFSLLVNLCNLPWIVKILHPSTFQYRYLTLSTLVSSASVCNSAASRIYYVKRSISE